MLRVCVAGPLHDGFQFRLWRVLREPLACPGGCCWPRAHSFAPRISVCAIWRSRYFRRRNHCDHSLAYLKTEPNLLSCFWIWCSSTRSYCICKFNVAPHKYESDPYKKLQLHREEFSSAGLEVSLQPKDIATSKPRCTLMCACSRMNDADIFFLASGCLGCLSLSGVECEI